MLMVVSAKCVPNKPLGVSVSEGLALDYDNLNKVYIEKIATELVLLKPTNAYQKLLYNKAKELVAEARKLYQNGHLLYLNRIYDAALVHYLASLYYVQMAQNILKFYSIQTLNDYVELLRSMGSFAVAATFSLYKASCVSSACSNSTRVVYVHIYAVTKKLGSLINDTITNLPGAFDWKLARRAVEVSNLTSEITIMAYTHYVLTLLPPPKDSQLIGKSSCLMKGLGNAPWLEKACYYIYHPLKPSPCSKFYGVVASYTGLKDLAKRLCGVGVG